MAVTDVYGLRGLVFVHGVVVFAFASTFFWATFSGGLVALGALLLSLFAAAGFLALATVTWWPGPPTAGEEDSTVIAEASMRLVYALLAAGVLLLAGSLALAAHALTADEVGTQDRLRYLLIGVLSTFVIWDLVRLARGRLYRWRLAARDEGLLVAGYHTHRVVPWREIESVRVADNGKAAEVVTTGGELVPVQSLPYALDPAEIARRITRRWKSASG